MADTLITPEVGTLTLIGRRPPPALPVYQLNGTDAVDGVVLPIYEFNGTDAVAGFKLAPYQLNGTDTVDGLILPVYETPGGSVRIEPSVGSLSLAGLWPDVLLSQVDKVPTTGAMSLSGLQPTVLNSGEVVIVPGAGAVSLSGLSAALSIGPENIITGAIDLLYHTTDTAGYDGPYADINLLYQTLEASGVGGDVLSASLTLLTHELSASGNEGADITLLAPTLEAEGIQGTTQNASITLLSHDITASGIVHGFGSAANELNYHEISADGIVNQIGSLTAELALHTLDGSGYAGVTGEASITLHVHTTSLAGFAAVSGSADIELAGHYLEAVGLQTLAEAYRTWVLNLRNSALTEYDNFSFNSYASFNGVYLAAGPGGIVVLGTQELDDASTIMGRVRTGAADYGSTFLKRVPRLYVTGEFPADMYFRTITSEDGERTYLLHTNGIAGVQQRRVPIGKGPKALKWQYELENIDGGDFRVSRVMPYPQELRRRVA